MRVFHQYGTRERLFEMLRGVNKLEEGVLEREEKERVINEFIGNVNQHLGITNQPPEITISNDPTAAAEMASFGEFKPLQGTILVVATNRNLADVLRTLAHEMVHYKQNLEGRLSNGQDNNADGSDIENEANSEAAIIMRKFGRDNPIIFE